MICKPKKRAAFRTISFELLKHNLEINGIESLSQVQVDNICLNIFFQVLTNGIKIDSSCVVQKPISQKVMLERTGEVVALLIIHNKEIGLLFSVCSIESFICTGVTLFFFHSEVMREVRKDR